MVKWCKKTFRFLAGRDHGQDLRRNYEISTEVRYIRKFPAFINDVTVNTGILCPERQVVRVDGYLWSREDNREKYYPLLRREIRHPPLKRS